MCSYRFKHVKKLTIKEREGDYGSDTRTNEPVKQLRDLLPRDPLHLHEDHELDETPDSASVHEEDPDTGLDVDRVGLPPAPDLSPLLVHGHNLVEIGQRLHGLARLVQLILPAPDKSGHLLRMKQAIQSSVDQREGVYEALHTITFFDGIKVLTLNFGGELN